MKKAFNKNIIRTIRVSLGRYLAILAIVALGVGFFAGIRVTKLSMIDTLDKFVTEHNMYDYKITSTMGFDKDAPKNILETTKLNDVNKNSISEAEGSITQDFFSMDFEGNSVIYRAHSITNEINTLSLTAGRIALKAGECVADKNSFGEDAIGSYITITKENKKSTKKILRARDGEPNEKIKIVGIADTPYYLMRTDRGTSSLGNGSISAFIYMPEEGFNTDYYTEIFMTCREQGYAYSKEYNDNIENAKPIVESESKKRANARYKRLYEKAKKKIDDSQAEIDDGWEEWESGRSKLSSEKARTKSKLAASKSKLDKSSKKIEKTEKELKTAKAQIKSNLSAAKQGVRDAEAMGDPETIACAKATLTELNSKLAKVQRGLDKIPSGKAKIKNGYKKYNSGIKKANNEFAKAQAKLDRAKAKLIDGEKKLEKARKKLADMKEPKIYIQNRDDNLGYDSFDSNSDIVNSIAKVFPIFFFLIAALVCSTTMSRMIEEERTQIGVLRALGYSRLKIMWKYMVYSGSAAVIGCILGFLLGSKWFPYAIYTAYRMMFDFAPLQFHFSVSLAVVSLLVSILCSVGTTWFACREQLKEMPAEILRPRAPKVGKRVFLEKIKPLWKRMKFLHKVSARNILRYKKRMVMMVMGIAGCTALVMAGLGIFDSVAGLANHQYDEIEKYDMTATFSEELTETEMKKFEENYRDEITKIAPLQEIAVSVKNKQATLIVTEDDGAMSELVAMRQGTTEGPIISYPAKGQAVINNKLAELIGVRVGDKITVTYDDTKKAILTVSGIYRNYVYNNVFVNAETFENDFDKSYEPDMAFIKFKKGTEPHEIAGHVNEFDDLAGMVLTADVRARVDKMMLSLNYIVYLVIACAAALAFIVMFNLSNINITERVREIATIKVLGFYPRETGEYVFRENFVLVIFGIVVGLPLGKLLHTFIMNQIIVDMVAFNNVLMVRSCFIAIGLVILFAMTVDVIMRRKLRKINMAEALKSIE